LRRRSEVGELLAVDDIEVLTKEVRGEVRGELDRLRDGAAAIGVELVRLADAVEGYPFFSIVSGPSQ
jgi:hypothetical protein